MASLLSGEHFVVLAHPSAATDPGKGAFGWFGKYRRLAKDYEALSRSSECMILIAVINLMVHRISPG